MSKREAILEAAKTLLWEEGYQAMSPRDVLERSGAGQGSFYHHFRGKLDLAEAALWEVNAEMTAMVDRIFRAERPPLERVFRYLTVVSRDPLKGCRMGRMTSESSIDNEQIRVPVASWFEHLENRVREALAEAQQAGQLRPEIDPADLAYTFLAVVQGGYVLARTHNDPTPMHRALAGAEALLRAAQTA